MSETRMFVAACVIIALQCALVGVLIWRKKFGCFSPDDKKEIAQAVVRYMYEDRQAELYRTLDELHRGRREVNPKDYEEDCA